MVIDRNFASKNRWSIAEPSGKMWDPFTQRRPFTTFNTQSQRLWWSIATLLLKKYDRSLNFSGKMWDPFTQQRPFTTFNTQSQRLWWSIATLLLKKGDRSLNLLKKCGTHSHREDHLLLLTPKVRGYGDRSQLCF